MTDDAAVEACRRVLAASRRRKAQLRLFDALAQTPERRASARALIDAGVCRSRSTHRADNAARALQKVARALRETLVRCTAELAKGGLRAACVVVWSSEEHEAREYALLVGPAGEVVSHRFGPQLTLAREYLARAGEILDGRGTNASDGSTLAHLCRVRDLVDRASRLIHAIVRWFGRGRDVS